MNLFKKKNDEEILLEKEKKFKKTKDNKNNTVSMEELNEEERKSVVGIQGNLWTEYVPTEAHADYMLYPRALAIAEIGWNGEQRPAYDQFKKAVVAVTTQLKVCFAERTSSSLISFTNASISSFAILRPLSIKRSVIS